MKAEKQSVLAFSPMRQATLPYARPFSSKPPLEAIDLAICDVVFPLTPSDRLSFRRTTGEKCSDFQWRLYDACVRIPAGRVTTYGALAIMLDSSARAVGSALRRNPFAPYVPCHRIVASDGYVGGFCGSWGKDSENGRKKLEMLKQEGVRFDAKGYLVGGKAAIWRGT